MSRVRISPPRPFFFSVHFGPNPPRAGELDAETRRGISATGDAKRRRDPRDTRHAGRRVRGGGFRLGRRDDEETGWTDFRAVPQRLGEAGRREDRRRRFRRRVVGACGKAAAPSVLVGLLPRLFRTGARTRFARRFRPPRAATCATSRPWRSFLTRGRERRKHCRAPMRNELLSLHNPVTLSRKSIL